MLSVFEVDDSSLSLLLNVSLGLLFGILQTRSMGAGGRRNVPAFDLNELKSELLLRGNGIDVVETLGADFSNQADLPIAGSYHCGHCG